MFCIGLLSGFNILVLITPPQAVSKILTLMPLPVAGRYVMLAAAIINVGVSMAYEEWGTPAVSSVVGLVTRWWQRGKRRTRNEKMYKVVEDGMI
jgi:cation-transporting ATPase 13A2